MLLRNFLFDFVANILASRQEQPKKIFSFFTSIIIDCKNAAVFWFFIENQARAVNYLFCECFDGDFSLEWEGFV